MVCSPNSEEPAYCEDKLDKMIEDAIKGACHLVSGCNISPYILQSHILNGESLRRLTMKSQKNQLRRKVPANSDLFRIRTNHNGYNMPRIAYSYELYSTNNDV